MCSRRSHRNQMDQPTGALVGRDPVNGDVAIVEHSQLRPVRRKREIKVGLWKRADTYGKDEPLRGQVVNNYIKRDQVSACIPKVPYVLDREGNRLAALRHRELTVGP